MFRRPIHSPLVAAAALCLLATVTAAGAQCGDRHTVVSGDTLWGIARECGTTVTALRAANPEIGPDALIHVGGTVRLPEADGTGAETAGEPAVAPGPSAGASDEGRYAVEPGDTLGGIARRFGVTLGDLLEANPEIDDPSRIFVDQVLDLPGHRGPGAPSGQDARIGISPLRGPAGAVITVEAAGFVPGSTVKIGIGPPRSEYEVRRRVAASADGAIRTTVTVPDWSDPGDELVVVADAVGRGTAKAVSEPFAVTAGGESDAGDGPDSEIHEVTGTLTEGGVECPALRADDGSLYTLTGDLRGFGAGDRVTVRGTVAEMSVCMQGTTLSVREIERAR